MKDPISPIRSTRWQLKFGSGVTEIYLLQKMWLQLYKQLTKYDNLEKESFFQ